MLTRDRNQHDSFQLYITHTRREAGQVQGSVREDPSSSTSLHILDVNTQASFRFGFQLCKHSYCGLFIFSPSASESDLERTSVSCSQKSLAVLIIDKPP